MGASYSMQELCSRWAEFKVADIEMGSISSRSTHGLILAKMPFMNYNESTIYQLDTQSVVYNEVMIGDTLRSASDRSGGRTSLPRP